MSEISSISTERMNNGAHFAYHTEVVACIESDAKVKTKAASRLQTYKNALAIEDQALTTSQKSFLTDEIVEADTQRDAFYLGFKNTVKAFADVPDGNMQRAYKILAQLLKDYNISVRMQLDKETGLMMNLINDLEGKYAAEVEALSLGSLLTVMKTANEKVRTAISSRNAEEAAREVGAMKAARVKVDEAYRVVVKYINACVVVEEVADYDDFIALINALIVRYKRQVLNQKADAVGGGTTPNPGDETPDPVIPGGGDDDETPDPFG